jgi:PAS domain S-box-containing protein
VSRFARLVGIWFAVVLIGATLTLAFLSFARKVDTFAQAGFHWEPTGGNAIRITAVDPQGAASDAGIAVGDMLVTIDGQTASSVARPEKALARGPFPHKLIVLSEDGTPRGVQVREPRVAVDRTYLFLAFVGFLYLIIGLFTAVRERSHAARLFGLLCLATFAVYVITPAGPRDSIWKSFLLGEDFYRALLPAFLLHFFLVFPRPVRARKWLALLYVPAAVYLAADVALLFWKGPGLANAVEWLTRAWLFYFAAYAAAALVRLFTTITRRSDAEVEKQLRWIGLGVTVGLAPFLLLAVLPRAIGWDLPLLSSLAVIPLVFLPLSFAYAILKWRLWDVEIFVREAVATTASVLLGAMTFVLVNTLLDRTLGQIASSGKNIIAFGSGLALASLLVPVKKRLTDVLEKIQYHDTYRARRALLGISRDFAIPRPKDELARALVERIQEGLHVVPCALFLFEGAAGSTEEAAVLKQRLEGSDLWHLRGSSFEETSSAAAARLHAQGYRCFIALRCGGALAGALGVGHRDGRVPLSTEDEAQLIAVMAQAGLAWENARLYDELAARLAEIRGLQQYQESVIRSSSSGIVVLDGKGGIVSTNPAFAQIVGLGEPELAGRAFSEVVPGVDPGPAPESGERAFDVALGPEGDGARNLRISVSALLGAEDRRVVIVDDVTDRVRAERAAAERERLAALGVLAAGVAHEVNTPIAGLSSYAQLLLAETGPADPRYGILKKMERQSFRAAHLVSNLLEFARPRPRHHVRTDLTRVLHDAAESVETTFAARAVDLRLEGNGPCPVLGDARELEQVLVNLLTNARDASPDGGSVEARIRHEGDSVRVEISDRGPGLPADAQEKVFQPFFSTKKSGGTGLGLAISREIVQRHGGELGLAAREGGGTEAFLRLPSADATSPEHPAGAEQSASEERSPSNND